MRECRDAARSLAADWRFTAAAVALLSLTVGASTAIYAIVHTVALRPLPFEQPDRVAMIWQRDIRRALPVIEVSYGEALDWRRRSRSFDEIAVIGSVNWPLPLSGNESLSFPGQVPEQPSTWGLNPHHNLQTVTPGYFEAMGIRVVAGRGLLPTDTLTSPGVVVVSRQTARRYWPGLDPIGQRLFDMSYRRPENAQGLVWQTVVGVVDDVRYRGLNDVRLDTYVPSAQSTHRVRHLMVRTTGDAGELVAPIRAAALAEEPGVSVRHAVAMANVVAAESAPWRFVVRVFLAFAVLAALLSAIGLGTVIALAVSTRRRELAIRAALGADRRRLQAVVMKEGTRLVVIGVLAGLACALLLSRAVAAVLVGVSPHDPIALAAAATIALGVGLTACWWPSRRAAVADPIEALRAE